MARSEIFLPFMPSGNGQAPIDITHGDLITNINNCTLVPGQVYYVIERPGGNVYVQAIDACTLAPTGFRGILCPTEYDVTTDAYGNNWVGVWRPELTDAQVAVGDLTIHGHAVWKNLTGNAGTKVDEYELDSTNWVLIPRESYTNHEYIELFFEITYDYENDWISKQYDGKGNVIGMDWSVVQLLGDPTHNPCDYTDWNMGTSMTPFFNNQVDQVLNNFNPGGIWNNTGGPILQNRTGGAINQNITEWGIKNNSCAQQIEFNISLAIDNNSNNGMIMGNLTPSNSIEGNTNNGHITNNVTHMIVGNLAPTTDIKDNVAPSGIYSNTINGEITNNTLSGDISYNTTLGRITNNKNNGNIKSNTSSVPVHIYNNVNNGNIQGVSRSADITDTVVNK